MARPSPTVYGELSPLPLVCQSNTSGDHIIYPIPLGKGGGESLISNKLLAKVNLLKEMER